MRSFLHAFISEFEDMPNEKNLKRPDDMTPEERRQRASEMGRASGAARRKKADLRKTMNTLLMQVSPVVIDGRRVTYDEAICYTMIREVIKGKDKVRAYRAIMDTVGQTSKSEMDIKVQRARLKIIENELSTLKEQAGIADDGFIEALEALAAEDWTDEEADPV